MNLFTEINIYLQKNKNLLIRINKKNLNIKIARIIIRNIITFLARTLKVELIYVFIFNM